MSLRNIGSGARLVSGDLRFSLEGLQISSKKKGCGMSKILEILKAAAGQYQGEGINHEGQPFTGRLALQPILHGRGFSLSFSATGKDGTLYHQEESTIAPSMQEKLTLWNFNTSTPGLLAHELRTSPPKNDAAHTFVFGFNQPADSHTFREEIALSIWGNGDLSYTYSWGMPGGEFKERSGARMIRKSGGSMDLNHCHIQVPDMKKARAFYESYFQFSEKLVCEENEVFLVNQENFVLGLEQVAKPEALPSWFHFGIGLKSEKALRDLFQKMKESGEPIIRELKDFGDTMNFYCSDPSGNKIEVYFDRK